MNENEFLRLTIKEILRSMAESILMSKSISKEYASSANKVEIERNLDVASEEIANRLITKLNVQQKELSKEEFESLVIQTVNQYFSEKNANRSSS